MAILTVRNVPEEVHRALRVRAAGGVDAFCIGSEMIALTQIRGAGDSFPAVVALRQLAAEVRAILEETVRPEGRLRLGSLLADIGRRAKLTDEDAAVFAQRDRTPAKPVRLT